MARGVPGLTPKIHLVAKLLVLSFQSLAVSSDQPYSLRAISVGSKHPRPVDQAWDGRKAEWSLRRRRPAVTSMSGTSVYTAQMDWRTTFPTMRNGETCKGGDSSSILSRPINDNDRQTLSANLLHRADANRTLSAVPLARSSQE